MSTLATMPVYLRSPKDLEVTLKSIQTLRATQPDLQLLVVDDHSPVVELWDALITYTEQESFVAHRMRENGGFSRAVNWGLRDALESGRDALLVNADMEFIRPGWLEDMEDARTPDGGLADIAGAMLIYANGLIQHAGIYYSLLTRSWEHWYRFSPYMLPEAHTPRICPVTGALQFIRHSTMEKIGVYDEDFRMGYEDVDYCLRAFNAGLQCVYQPSAVAIHHESLFRGNADGKLADWQTESWVTLQRKHRDTPASAFYPAVV